MKRVILLVNGPGELWGWGRPLCRELTRRHWSVTLQFLPCPFASGREAEAASSLDVTEIRPSRTAFSLAMSLEKEKADAVVQLGGDLFWGRFCALRTGAPLGCYAYGFKKGMSHCRKVWTAFPFMADRMMERGIFPRLAGDLVRDGLAMDEGPSPWTGEERPRLALFPGSRPAIREKALGYLEVLVKRLKRDLPALEWVSLLSPFSGDDEFSRWTRAGMNPTRQGAGCVLPGATFALTQPGTNTLELMHTLTPGLVAVPFHFIRQVPLSGIKGMVVSLPLIGGWLKESYLKRISQRVGFLSWPNRIVGGEVLWEEIGELPPEEAAGVVARCLRNHSEIRRRVAVLGDIAGDEGAASRVCDDIEEMVRKR